MLSIPIIPILIFIGVLITPIIFGFVRGWKATLFISQILFLFTLVFIGLGFILYDWLWELFRNYFFYDFHPGLDKEALKEVSKSSIIMTFVGISLIPAYAITLGIYYPFRHFFKKDLYPKTKEINQNKKEIVKSMHIYSRLSGVAIGSFSSLFLASTAATASAVIFSSKDKYVGFNNFITSLSKIYTLGNGKYTKNMEILHDFASGHLDPEVQKKLKSVFYLDNKDNFTEVNNDFNEIINSDFSKAIKELENDNEAITIIMNFILDSQIKTINKKVEMIDNGYIPTDFQGNLTSQTFAHINLTKEEMINHLNGFSNLPKLGWKLNQNIIDNLKNNVKNNQIMPFENSGFYLQFIDQKKLTEEIPKWISNLEKKISNMQTQIQSNFSAIEKIYSDLISYEKELIKLGVDGTNDNYKMIKFGDPENYQGTNKILSSTGTIKIANDKFIAAKDVRDQKQNIKDLENINFFGSKDKNSQNADPSSTFGIDKSNELDKIKAEQDKYLAKIDYENAVTDHKKTSDYLDANAKLIKSEQEKYNNIKQSNIDELKNKASNAQNLSNQYSNEISLLISNKNTLETQMSNLENQKLTVENDINAKQNQINTLNQTISNLNEQKNEAIKNNQTSLVSKLESEISSAENDLKSAEEKLNQLSNDASSISLEIKNKVEAINLEESKISEKNKLKKEQDEIFTNNSSEARDLEREKENHLQILTNAKSLTNELVNNLNNKLIDKTNKKATLENLEKIFLEKESKYNEYHNNSFLPKKAIFDKKNEELSDANSFLNQKEIELNQLKQSKQQILTSMINLINERNNLLNNLYSLSDGINAIKSQNPGKHEGERYNDGDLLIEINDNHKYNSSGPQSDLYYKWATETIPGAKNYLSNSKIKLTSLEKIKNEKRIEYQKIENKYLEVFENILKN